MAVSDVAPLGPDAETVRASRTNMLCRQVLTYRMAWTDEGTSAREELPPTWLIIDEAHTLVPRSGETPAKDAIIGYAKLGRRFGCSLVLCTQQPSAVSDDAISQADLIVSHSLSHDNDIRALQHRAPAVMPEQFKEKVFISSLPRGVALAFDQATENKRGFIMQVRPRLSQHGGTDRLSGLFEAVKLLGSEETTEEMDIELRESLEEEVEEPSLGEEEEAAEDLPDVPRPPLKLSKEDWKTLDNWMKKYIEELFQERAQEFSLTDEPSPREIDSADEVEEVKPGLEHVPVSSLDPSEVRIRRFENIPKTLLSKAAMRKVLYSRTSHDFLFTSQDDHRDQLVVERTAVEPEDFIGAVAGGLASSGLEIDRLIHEDGFTFVCFRKGGIRAAFAVGETGESYCAPIVVIGSDRKEVERTADRIRSAFYGAKRKS
jgi:hypothetical protein